MAKRLPGLALRLRMSYLVFHRPGAADSKTRLGGPEFRPGILPGCRSHGDTDVNLSGAP